MHFIKSAGEDLVFRFGKREKRLFLDVLKLYPVIPSSHHRVTKSDNIPQGESCQRLLEEALAEQKAENQRKLQQMLNEEGRFTEVKTVFQFRINPHETEWLLQILNDVRVGSWLILGQPDQRSRKAMEWTEENIRHLAAMEACEYFEWVLLRAIDERGSLT
ncbi:MAG: hypothetical protein HY735_26050 [Verrucomicrobia bacterium]|nr:hypothetical protein [Verrucomicrobiota bacterium]